jgi:hypothetical protein
MKKRSTTTDGCATTRAVRLGSAASYAHKALCWLSGRPRSDDGALPIPQQHAPHESAGGGSSCCHSGRPGLWRFGAGHLSSQASAGARTTREGIGRHRSTSSPTNALAVVHPIRSDAIAPAPAPSPNAALRGVRRALARASAGTEPSHRAEEEGTPCLGLRRTDGRRAGSGRGTRRTNQKSGIAWYPRELGEGSCIEKRSKSAPNTRDATDDKQIDRQTERQLQSAPTEGNDGSLSSSGGPGSLLAVSGRSRAAPAVLPGSQERGRGFANGGPASAPSTQFGQRAWRVRQWSSTTRSTHVPIRLMINAKQALT